MSLNVSPEVEARIVANAREAGVPVDDYLEQVLGENEEFATHARHAEAASTPLTREEVQAKIKRGLEQLERGDCADGEPFLAELLASIDAGDKPDAG